MIAMSITEQKETKREYERLRAKAVLRKVTVSSYDTYQEEYIALEGDAIIAHAINREALSQQLMKKGLDPSKYRVVKAGIKLIL